MVLKFAKGQKIPYHSHWPGSDNDGDYGCWTAIWVCYFLCMRLFGLVKESVRSQEKWAEASGVQRKKGKDLFVGKECS